MVQKINVIKEDFKCNPIDVRFSVPREIPTFGEYEMDRKRNKTRHSFVRKNLSIDMTISSGDGVDMDSEEECLSTMIFSKSKPSDSHRVLAWSQYSQRQRCQCKECGGSQICEHGRRRSTWQECGGSQICAHFNIPCEIHQIRRRHHPIRRVSLGAWTGRLNLRDWVGAHNTE